MGKMLCCRLLMPAPSHVQMAVWWVLTFLVLSRAAPTGFLEHMVSEHLTQWCRYDVLLEQPSLGKGSVFCLSLLLFSKKRPTNIRYLRALSKQTEKASSVGEQKLSHLCPLQCLWHLGLVPNPSGREQACTMPLQNHYLCFSHQESSSIQGFLVSKSKSSEPLSHKVGPVSHRIWMPSLCPGASPNYPQEVLGLCDAFSPT